MLLDVTAKGIYGLISAQGTQRIIRAAHEGEVHDPDPRTLQNPPRPVGV